MEPARRRSAKREAIYNCICGTKSHPSAEWVYEQLKDEHPDLSLGTVYRNMNLFKKDGLIITVANVDGTERYDGCTKEHAHFVCNECGSVIDVEPDDVPSLSESVQRKYGCIVERQDIVFKGLCKKCAESKGESA